MWSLEKFKNDYKNTEQQHKLKPFYIMIQLRSHFPRVISNHFPPVIFCSEERKDNRQIDRQEMAILLLKQNYSSFPGFYLTELIITIYCCDES